MSTKRQQAHPNAGQRAAVARSEKAARTCESAAAERNAELDAVRERTERLKALRLAHEARIQQHLRSVKAGSKSRAAAKRQAKEPEKKITLADWLAQQRAFGRET